MVTTRTCRRYKRYALILYPNAQKQDNALRVYVSNYVCLLLYGPSYTGTQMLILLCLHLSSLPSCLHSLNFPTKKQRRKHQIRRDELDKDTSQQLEQTCYRSRNTWGCHSITESYIYAYILFIPRIR